MLRLRGDQWRRFDAMAEDIFVDDLALAVRDVHGELVKEADDEDLKHLVRVGVERARGHGLTFESSIAVFVGLMFEFAPNFDEQPNIRRMLADRTIPPDDRIDVVVESASEDDWAEAERLYDEDAWEGPTTGRAPSGGSARPPSP